MAKNLYLERLLRSSAAELEADATRAIRSAVERAHAAGLSTLGADENGSLIVTHPDGSSTPYEPTNGSIERQ